MEGDWLQSELKMKTHYRYFLTETGCIVCADEVYKQVLSNQSPHLPTDENMQCVQFDHLSNSHKQTKKSLQ